MKSNVAAVVKRLVEALKLYCFSEPLVPKEDEIHLLNGAEPPKAMPPEHSAEPVEMLTIKECSEAVSGLSEHTVRQLVAQKKIPYIRTGQGKRGKILISKSALLDYMKGAA